jgi:hypothetical protein
MRDFVRVVFTATLAAVALAGAASAEERLRPCETSRALVGRCFVVHGRLADWYQGAWPVKLWIVGTPRLLGIIDVDQRKDERDTPILPRNVRRALGGDPTRPNFVYGDFKVCPMSAERRGQMRFVCLQSGAHLFAVPAR